MSAHATHHSYDSRLTPEVLFDAALGILLFSAVAVAAMILMLIIVL